MLKILTHSLRNVNKTRYEKRKYERMGLGDREKDIERQKERKGEGGEREREREFIIRDSLVS